MFKIFKHAKSHNFNEKCKYMQHQFLYFDCRYYKTGFVSNQILNVQLHKKVCKCIHFRALVLGTLYFLMNISKTRQSIHCYGY